MKRFNMKSVRLWACALPLVTSFLLSPSSQVYAAGCGDGPHWAECVEVYDEISNEHYTVTRETDYMCVQLDRWDVTVIDGIEGCDPEAWPPEQHDPPDPDECQCDLDGWPGGSNSYQQG